MNNKTYTILQSFDKYEVNRLRKFLQSPYFNMNEAIVILFEVFIKDIFAKSTKELTKEIIWSKIYGQKKYDDVRFRKLNSELLKLVEKFLAQQVYEENPLLEANQLISSVGNRKLEKLYNSTMKSCQRISNQQKYKSVDYYYFQYQREKNYYELIDFDTKRRQRSNIEEITNNLDFFYFAEKLRIYCYILSENRENTFKYKIDFIEEIIDYLKNKDILNLPPILIYYSIIKIYLEPENEDHYFKLKEIIGEHINYFPPKEANKIYTYALNYCSGKINKGVQTFLREYFNIYRATLKNKIMFSKVELPPWEFKNIVLVALRLGEYKWAEMFISDYNEYIPEIFRENAITYNKAQLFFYQKKYNKVIRLLNQVEYEDLAYNLNSKLMLLAVYYETDEIEPLYSLMETFRVYLNRNKKLPTERKQIYINFIKFTKKLSKLIPGDKKAIEKLKGELSDTQGGIVNLKWLKEKIAELE